MKYSIWTFGCQMNESDSQRIATILEKQNYKPVRRDEEADLIIVNACSVRQSAIDRIYGKVKYFNQLKIKNSKLKIILTGCVLDQDKEKMAEIFDQIIDISKINKLPVLLDSKIKIDKSLENYFHIKPKYESKIEAYVPIMTGCNNFCSYCVVPYTRGREISRPASEIINEITNLVKNGYKKITLLGQNVNSYKNKEIDFLNLIKLINNIPGNFWFSFLTNHPKDMSDELIMVLPNLEKFCHCVHLPLQSGNNKILKEMNRHYTCSQYLSLVQKIRKALPDVSLSTDIIVGFPGETKKQFSDTVGIIKKAKFDMAYIAGYSPRSQTTAYKLKDNVPREEKIKRQKALNQILAKTALSNNKKYIGKVIEALVKGKSKKKGMLYGETKTLKNLEFKSNKNIVGKFVKIKITKVASWSIYGELV